MSGLSGLELSGEASESSGNSPILAIVAVALILGAMGMSLWMLKSGGYADNAFFRRRAQVTLVAGPILILLFLWFAFLR